MIAKLIHVLNFMSICLAFIEPVIGQECKQQAPISHIRFNRTFIFMTNGPADLPIPDRDNAVLNLGACRTPEENAEKAMEFFKSFYDFDARHILQNPFKVYDLESYKVRPYAPNPLAMYRVISGTLFDQAKSYNDDYTFVTFSLTAKKDLTGPKGKIKAGNWIVYGMFRMKDGGSDFCSEYWLSEPAVPYISIGGVTVAAYKAYHKNLGRGDLQGMVRTEANIRYSIAILSFPSLN